jgi:hypothetical protein
MTNNSSFDVPVTVPAVAPPSPNRRVNYTQGMVLGVDDFDQEFAFLTGRDQWIARDLIGYGTVCGLRVYPDTEGRPRIVVTSGVAVSPQGQKITVTDDQCAYLEDWLGTRAVQDAISAQVGSPPMMNTVLTVYVVLCYRECLTEKLPIAGEPCRTDEEATVATRVQDDFRLELRFAPPAQTEEDALRDFVGWLATVPITDSQPPTPLADFERAIREAVFIESPLSPFSPFNQPDYMVGSPPSALVIPTAEACEYLRTAFRIWTTELRPRWRGTQGGCVQLPDEECVLLGEVGIPILSAAGRWMLDGAGNITLDERRRPFIVHLRLLQEWLLCNISADALPPVLSPPSGPLAMGGDVSGTTDNATVEALRNIPVVPDIATPPADNQVLSYDAGNVQWIARTITEGITNLGGDATGAPDNNTVERLQNIPVIPTAAAPPDDNQVLSYDSGSAQWVARTIVEGGPVPNLGGDATGAPDDNTVERLQNIPVIPSADAPPANNQVLSYDAPGQRWVARTVTDPQAVQHTALVYEIVAAGIVRVDGSTGTPLYNGLQVIGVFDAGVLITFKGYTPPDGSFMYIIKVLPVLNIEDLRPVIIHFASFEADHFILRLLGADPNGDLRWTRENILESTLEFMIEVSRYEAEG